MRNCLNPRRTNTYEIQETDEQTDLPQKLQKRHASQYQELTDSTDAWWRSPLKCQKKQDMASQTGPVKKNTYSGTESNKSLETEHAKNGEKPLAQKLREALLLEEDPIHAQMLKRAYDKEIARLVEESK